jgi:hypothetical protein
MIDIVAFWDAREIRKAEAFFYNVFFSAVLHKAYYMYIHVVDL